MYFCKTDEGNILLVLGGYKNGQKKPAFSFDAMPAIKRDKRMKVVKVSPKRAFKNRKEVAVALFQCLENNDPESFIEILDVYLDVNRTEIAERANLSRNTVQNAFSRKGNPTIRTIAQIVHEAVA